MAQARLRAFYDEEKVIFWGMGGEVFNATSCSLWSWPIALRESLGPEVHDVVCAVRKTHPVISLDQNGEGFLIASILDEEHYAFRVKSACAFPWVSCS